MTERVKVVRFTSTTSCDGSATTDKRNNLRRSKSKNTRVSGIRSKFVLEGLRQELYSLQQENEHLRRVVMDNVNPPELAEGILRDCESPPVDIFLCSSTVMEEDETKEGDTSHDSSRADADMDQQERTVIRIGQEIDVLRPPVPVKELGASYSKQLYAERDTFTVRSLEFDPDRDEAQCLFDVFTSDFAY